MRLSHTLLIALAGVLWAAARIVAPSPPAAGEQVPALAISGSAYGSLMARTMRSSLYAYWHGGEAYRAPAVNSASVQSQAESAPPPPPPSTPGVFSRRRFGAAPSAMDGTSTALASASTQIPALAIEPEPENSGPPLDRAAAWLNTLEKHRTRRSGQAPMSPAHLHYINASVGWRLRLAYNLDPGDPMLYEILHHHTLTTSQDIAQARNRSQMLAWKALAHAKSSQAGMADSLTGVGAAINALNETIVLAQPNVPPKEEIFPLWESLTSCQQQFHDTRAAAEREGWWKNIPPTRRMEIDEYARLLDRLTGQFQKYLVGKGYVVNRQ